MVNSHLLYQLSYVGSDTAATAIGKDLGPRCQEQMPHEAGRCYHYAVEAIAAD